MNINLNFSGQNSYLERTNPLYPSGNTEPRQVDANSLFPMMFQLMQIMSQRIMLPYEPSFGGSSIGAHGQTADLGRTNEDFLGGISSNSNASANAVSSDGGASGTQGGQGAVDMARRFLGRRSRDIKGEMPHFQAAGGLTNNCADFVSSALQSAGVLGGHEVNCRRLERRLQNEGWHKVPAAQAKAGDVAFNPSRGHVVLCQGGGKMIGSNNVRQGLQYISEKTLPQSFIVYSKG